MFGRLNVCHDYYAIFGFSVMDKVDEMVKCNGRAQSRANRRKELEDKKLSKLGQAKKKLPQCEIILSLLNFNFDTAIL